jgi:ribosomal-protein-alanine N-acetyltransferase
VLGRLMPSVDRGAKTRIGLMMLYDTKDIRGAEMIETERLRIRPFVESDSLDLFEYLSIPSVYLFEPGAPLTLDDAKEMAVQRSTGSDFLAVVLKETDKMIGHLYFKRMEPIERRTWELGYIFNPKYHGKGYASEAAAAITQHAFGKLKAHRIMARCNTENTASWRLLERIGYVREGYFRKCGFLQKDEGGNPIWTDAFEYSKLEETTI